MPDDSVKRYREFMIAALAAATPRMDRPGFEFSCSHEVTAKTSERNPDEPKVDVSIRVAASYGWDSIDHFIALEVLMHTDSPALLAHSTVEDLLNKLEGKS